MPTGRPPETRFIARADGEEKWTELGGGWKNASGNVTVRIDMEAAQPYIKDGVLRCLEVKNTPKQTQPIDQPATKQPETPAPRQRRRAAEEPRTAA